MNSDNYQLLDDTRNKNLTVKRDFAEICHRKNVPKNSNESGKIIDIFFVEKPNQQFGNENLQFDMKSKNGDYFEADSHESIRLVKIELGRMFKEAYFFTTGGTDMESNNFVGQVSTIMRVLTSKTRDSSSYFAKNNENNNKHTSSKEMINEIHVTQADKRKIIGQLK